MKHPIFVIDRQTCYLTEYERFIRDLQRRVANSHGFIAPNYTGLTYSGNYLSPAVSTNWSITSPITQYPTQGSIIYTPSTATLIPITFTHSLICDTPSSFSETDE